MKIKMLFKESLIWAFWSQKMWVQVGSKWQKRLFSYHPPYCESLKQSFNSQSPNTLGKLKDKLTDLYKTLQIFIFY